MESKNNISLEECYEKYKEYISKQKMDPDKKLEIKKQVELIIENKNKYEKIIEKFYENSELEYNNRYLRLNIEEKILCNERIFNIRLNNTDGNYEKINI